MNLATAKTNIYDLPPEGLFQWLEDRAMAPYRGLQVLKWLYQRRCRTFDEMTDITKTLRQELAEHFIISLPEVVEERRSADGSSKLRLRMADGALIESVLMPEPKHSAVCISSQVGCAMGCLFCLTGSGGLARDLTRGEIVGQVIAVMGRMAEPKRLRNIVMMGMGEPLANYANVVSALAALTDGTWGTGFSCRRVTLSTVGLAPRLADLGRDTDVSLAVSLNAADDQTRSALMPVNRRYPLEVLIEACRRFPLKPTRRITFEYILIKDVNDGPDHAKRLAKLLRPVKAKINLIPFNPHAGCDFARPDEETILAFQKILVDSHYTAIIRKSKGQDIGAACGQLGGRSSCDTASAAYPHD